MDCGPTCLKMISKFYGKSFKLQSIRSIAGMSREGVSLRGISEAAEVLGLRSSGMMLDADLIFEIDLPVIIHWNQNHFVILYKINRGNFYVADPAKGLLVYNFKEFCKHWLGDANSKGIVLALSPTPKFYLQDGEKEDRLTFTFLVHYLKSFKKLILQLFIGLIVGTILQLIFPLLTQSIVDIGINTRNISFIYIILIAQTMLLVGRLSIDFIRSWILLHISARINISILTDFITKLMKLPMNYFDTKMTGDIMQRINDQARIQSFLTGSTLNTIFSLFNLFVFTLVLAFYDSKIFFIFLISSALYTLWVMVFLKKRRKIDIARFEIASKNQGAVVQLISGMQEIKLNNAEQEKRWEWERIQASLFNISVRNLSLGQAEQTGGFFINEGKNIIITFIVATAVINGQLTLGAMLAIQYIVGQLNSPIEQLINFMQQFQDAKISLERLNEIHQMEDEEIQGRKYMEFLPADLSINLKNVTFYYPGDSTKPVISNLNLRIPAGKTTAIVGSSGSGKTTLLKLLLRFYTPQAGTLRVGENNIDQYGFKFWRSQCGAVLQDGYIFSDTIAKNIVVNGEDIDIDRLEKAIIAANLADFIEKLPLGLQTKIGAEGNGISQGQRQRILIARSVYKNPNYLFFDEATNALDAKNEKVITNNMEVYFKGKTVVVVAHRLSTVKHADNIIVLDNGVIIEQGNHEQLIFNKGSYYELVRNQLELGD